MVNYPLDYEDIDVFSNSLVRGFISFGNYVGGNNESNLIKETGYIKMLSYKKLEEESNSTNVLLDIDYETTNWVSEQQSKTKRLAVFSPKGVDKWSIRMVNKIWDGREPSTVAIDLESKELYLVYINSMRKSSAISLLLFQTLTDSDVETIMDNFNDNTPFKFTLSEEAMFKYIDGEEGLRYLQEGVKVVFDCGIPLEIRSN